MSVGILDDQHAAAFAHGYFVPYVAADVVGYAGLHVLQVVPCDAAVVQRRGDEYRIPFEQYEQLVGLVVYVQLVDLFERLRRGIIENGRLPHRPDEERVVARFTRGITIDNFHVQVHFSRFVRV